MDQEKHMWKYWRDDCGYEYALENYYPEISKEPQMQAAIAQLKNAKVLIDALMAAED